jgi:hypothetical protein
MERLNSRTNGGVLGMIAGRVKVKDEMLVVAAAVLLAGPVWRSEGLLVGLAVGIAVIVGGALLVRMRKWRAGAPRGSSDY